MFRIIFLTTLGASVLTMAVFVASVAGIIYVNISDSQREALKTELALVSAGVTKGGIAYLEAAKAGHVRMTWIGPDGQVRFESQANAEAMDNHLAREEVALALAAGSAESCRHSPTLSKNVCYAARRLEDGSIVRLGIATDSFLSILKNFMMPQLYIILLSIAVSFFLARLSAKRIVAPLGQVDLDKPLENEAYPELAPFLRRIDAQQRKISSQYQEIMQNYEDFINITSAMSEGLVIMDARFGIISINESAKAIFKAPEDSIGHNFLQIDRNMELNKSLELALKTGLQKFQLARNGLTYLATVSRFDNPQRGAFLVLLVLDITEHAEAEQRRREFSANVSHELKTPLQTIMGSAEMLENGLVKEDDVSPFGQKIHAEATRLLKLTNDILHLSSLDEQMPEQDMDFDLYEIAGACQQQFARLAEEKNIAISVGGESARIRGPRSLAEEIVYNLCENAIKYNKQDGSVKLSVARENGAVVLSVIDSGIGIPRAELERIFERFYRCDKSHSKAIDGTGLGLSIVKQALKHFNAQIKVISEPGLGSKFTVIFPGFSDSQARDA